MPVKIVSAQNPPTATEANQMVQCVNQTYQYLRNQGASVDFTDWTTATLNAFAQMGYKAAIYQRTADANRVYAVAVYGVENIIHPPDVSPQVWGSIKLLAVRVQAIADADQETFSKKALFACVPDLLNNFNVVGIIADYPAKWTRLHNFLANNFPQTEFESRAKDADDNAITERAWIRKLPGAPGWTAMQATVDPT